MRRFLHTLATSGADADDSGRSPARLATVSISCGDPQRNKNYRAALFGSNRSDPIEARAAARIAVSERPAHTPPLVPELRTLRAPLPLRLRSAGAKGSVTRHKVLPLNSDTSFAV